MEIKEKYRIKSKQYRIDNPDRVRNIERKAQEKLKYETMYYYSNGTMVCNLCGFSNIDALVLDHINDDGGVYRRSLGGKNFGGVCLYKKLRKDKFPEGLQVLCCNCNMIKQINKFKSERI